MRLQGVDAEGASPSSAAPGPQLQGAWGSGTIASRLAQAQKGEGFRMHRCLPGIHHALHADVPAGAGLRTKIRLRKYPELMVQPQFLLLRWAKMQQHRALPGM